MTETVKLNMIEAINRALHDACEANPKVLALGEDLADNEGGGVVAVTRGLSTRFGTERIKSTPISEQAIIGAAIGASLAGYRPVAEIMLMNFVTVAMDMITNHAAKLRFMSGGQTNVPIVIRTMTGSGFSQGGQHSDFLEAWFAHTPGIKVVAPSNPSDAYGLMRSAIDDNDPVMFIENIALYWTPGEVDLAPVPLGKARVVREGSDASIVTYAAGVAPAAAAAEELAGEGISTEIIDLRTVAPWDRETVLASVARTGRAVVVHEAVKEYGVGAEISSVLQEELWGTLKAPVRRVGGAFCPVPFAKPLENAFAPNAAAIAAAVRTTMR